MGRMVPLSRDTSAAAERQMLEALRRLTPGARIRLACDATTSLRQVVQAGLRLNYPQAGSDEMRRRFAARWLGSGWARRIYAWDPEEHGW